jgi:hypothetical protein
MSAKSPFMVVKRDIDAYLREHHGPEVTFRLAAITEEHGWTMADFNAACSSYIDLVYESQKKALDIQRVMIERRDKDLARTKER